MNTWQFILDKTSASIDVILLYVLESKGSSPGRQGFRMAVAADHEFCGTIGGGIMEHKFVEMAKTKLQEEESETGLYKQVHDKTSTKNQSGMICSGEQTIFLYRIRAVDIGHIEVLVASLTHNRNGSLQLSHAGLHFSEKIPEQDFYFQQNDDTHFLLVEKTGLKNQLHIVGGGHCALALSRLMREMDFYIVVYDEREELNTMLKNEFAHERKVLPSYRELGSMIEGGDNVYVVIMTFGYRTDNIALKTLLYKRFKYLGVLGSKKKMEKMFAEYRKEALPEELLKKIHSPVGIQIKSQTTAEIAVSIAAEIISVKNQ